MIKLALLATDNREQKKRYDLEMPFFDAAQTALLEGFRSLPDDIEVHVISCSKRAISGPSKLAENIHFYQPVVPHIGWGRSAFAGCALAVRRLLMHLKPDIVHGQGSERDCAISAVYSRFPNVLTIHGNMQQIYRMRLLGANSYYWLASTLETHALKRTTGVFCNSIHTRSLVENRTHKTWLVPNPLRAAFFAPRSSAKQLNPAPVLLVIGVVSKLKRPLEILEIAKRLARQSHRFQIRFIGNTSTANPYGAAFAQAISEGRAAGYADYLGVLDETGLIQAMDAADACVHFPSEEAFGLVVAEALARGLKLFAAKVGGIPDIAEGVEGAELHEDFLSLEHAIARWLVSGAPQPSHAADVMRSRYHPDVIGARHLQIYRELLGTTSQHNLIPATKPVSPSSKV